MGVCVCVEGCLHLYIRFGGKGGGVQIVCVCVLSCLLVFYVCYTHTLTYTKAAQIVCVCVLSCLLVFYVCYTHTLTYTKAAQIVMSKSTSVKSFSKCECLFNCQVHHQFFF